MKSLIIPFLSLSLTISCGTKKSNPYLLYREKNTEWIKLAREGQFVKGIESLNQIMKDSTYRNPHINHLDLSRMFAMKGDYKNAIKHREISKEIIKNPKDGPWIWHHHGTVAFFQKDKKSLDSILKLSWEKESEIYQGLEKDLISLRENFTLDYRKATIFKY